MPRTNLLHEFMSSHREEILRACELELQNIQAGEGSSNYASDFFDETLMAIRRDSGIAESTSPLPESSDAAARFGATRQRSGVPITQVPKIFAAISQAVGKTGEHYDLTISAEEYKMFNRCLDVGVATAIENFWSRDKTRETKVITERFGFMAHELRNALGNASLAFKLLCTGDLGTNGHTGEVLGRNLVRMEALIAQWLGSVQLEAGVKPTLQPIQVASVIRNLEASAILDRGVTITLRLDDEAFILADELLLTSAVSNLIHNAVKFSPPGGVVRLRTVATTGVVYIQVEDECGGLAHPDPSQLFDPYIKTRDGNRTGTGLGLSITKQAVEAMNGTVSVMNIPGHGCIFSIQFPAMPLNGMVLPGSGSSAT